jgi:multidrug resistance efflux pump
MKERGKNQHVVKHYYLRHAAPAAVWLLAVATVVWLFYQRAERFEIVGMARGQVRQIAASSPARIKDIPCELFRPVTAGQILAIVDTVLDDDQMLEAELKGKLAAAGAEAERLAALLVPTQEQLQADIANRRINRESSWRRFLVDAETAQLRVYELEAEIGSDQITLGGLNADVSMMEKLLAQEAVAPYELEKTKVQRDSLAAAVAEKQKLLEQARTNLEQARERCDLFAQEQLPAQSEDASLEAIRKEIRVQGEVMKGLLEQSAALQARRAVELRSPIDGIVIPIRVQRSEALQQRPGEQVMRRPGEVVTAGDPILAVAETEPNEIIAYVNERQLARFEAGTPVELIKTRMPAQIARSNVVSVGPAIELIPQRLWRNPNLPQWGRPILIDVPPGLALISGEFVGIRRL